MSCDCIHRQDMGEWHVSGSGGVAFAVCSATDSRKPEEEANFGHE